jgi:hypothetical protein
MPLRLNIQGEDGSVTYYGCTPDYLHTFADNQPMTMAPKCLVGDGETHEGNQALCNLGIRFVLWTHVQQRIRLTPELSQEGSGEFEHFSPDCDEGSP